LYEVINEGQRRKAGKNLWLRRASVFLLVLAFSLPLLIVVARENLASWRYSRDMQCHVLKDDRMRELCTGIESNLEYTCCGHATISPGYRATLKTIAAAWCDLKVVKEDEQLLVDLSGSEDWRLGTSAESLLRLLTGHDLYGTPESESSVLHPSHAAYLLASGCNGQE
jgi:hypothetical protein